MKGKRWTTKDDKYLLEMHRSGVSLSEIAKHLQRTEKAIDVRLYVLGKQAPQKELPLDPKPRVRVETSQVPTDPMVARLIAEVKMYKQLLARQAQLVSEVLGA